MNSELREKSQVFVLLFINLFLNWINSNVNSLSFEVGVSLYLFVSVLHHLESRITEESVLECERE